MQKLFRFTDAVVFSFDGDAAGRRAARRALEVSLPHLKDGKDVAFLFLPAEHDPDSYIRAEGAPAFEALLAHAMPLSAFLVEELRREHPDDHAEGRAAMLHQAVEWIAQVRAPALSVLLRQWVAEAVRVPRQDLDHLLATVLPRPLVPEQRAERGTETPVGAPAGAAAWQGGRSGPPRAPQGRRESPMSLEDRLVACLLQEPALVHSVDPDPADADLAAPTLAAVADFIRGCPDTPNLASFLEAFRDGPHARAIERAVRRELPAIQASEGRELGDVLQAGLLRLMRQRDERELDELIQREQQGLGSEQDRERLQLLLQRRK